MVRVTYAALHLPIAEVKYRMRTDLRADWRQRWLIIYNALVEPRAASEIAGHCGVSKATVHAVISRYNRLGVAAVETPGKGGRRRQYLTLEEEKEFLAPFFMQAERGEAATVEEIWRAFEQRVGRTVDDSTIYRLLHHHGWRKLMPRPKHPKSDLKTQEQFKKKTLRASEQDEVARAAWREKAKQLPIVDLVVVDETGSRTNMTPLYSYAPRGKRAIGKVPRNYGANLTLIASLSLEGMGEAMLLDGSADEAAFETYIEQILAPSLRPGQIVILDNLSIHPGSRVKQAIEARDCQLLFLPAYSPDFSPIEGAFSKLKAILRRVGVRRARHSRTPSSRHCPALLLRMRSAGFGIVAILLLTEIDEKLELSTT